MVRIFFILLLLFLGVWVALWIAKRRLLRWLASQFPETQAPSIGSEKLVKCSVCGTFKPLTQAIQVKDCYYCCKEHANMDKGKWITPEEPPL